MARSRSSASGRGNGARRTVTSAPRSASSGTRRCPIGTAPPPTPRRTSSKWTTKKSAWNRPPNRVKVELSTSVADVWSISCLIHLGKSIVNSQEKKTTTNLHLYIYLKKKRTSDYYFNVMKIEVKNNYKRESYVGNLNL